jgi:molecular chaperone IbpA
LSAKFQAETFERIVGVRPDSCLLNIELQREIPEALKPRKIAIDG